VNIEGLLRAGRAGLDVVDSGMAGALKAFADACRRFDLDRRERQRIRGLAELIDAEDARYEQALIALKNGDNADAEALLRRAANAGIGEADFLLAGLLQQRGDLREALEYYQRAHLEGDTRATMMLSYLADAPVKAIESGMRD
jgi:tetratricopeptide (TPR) repeat protein